VIVIIYKRYKREDAVDTTIQVEKNQNMPEAERMIEETSQV